MKTFGLFCLAAVAVQGPLISCSLWKPAAASAAPLTEKERFFVAEVRPVLERQCLRCHNGTTLPGKFNLSSGETALEGRLRGQRYITPGHPEQSLMITAVSHKGTHRPLMPNLVPLTLTEDSIGVLREWIEDGAVWPTGSAGQLKAVANPENP